MRTEPKRRRKAVPAAHDLGYRRLFSHAQTIEELIRGFLREDWVGRLDFSTLEQVETSFVSDGLLGRRSDVVWRLRRRGAEGGQKVGWLYVYLLLEFQSTSYHFMAVRLLTYVSLLLEQVIRTERLRSGDRLPAVFPLVLYNGKRPWRAPLELGSLFTPVPEGLARHLPNLSYLVLDESRLDLTRPELAANPVAALFRIETCASPEELPRLTEELAGVLPKEDPELRRTINVWLRSVLRRQLQGGTIATTFDLEDASMLEENLIAWRNKFLREGRREGQEKGLQQGLKKGLREGQKLGLEKGIERGLEKGRVEGMRELLIRLTAERFGPLPEEARARLDAIASAEEIDRLSQRLLTARSLSELGLEAPAAKRAPARRRS